MHVATKLAWWVYTTKGFLELTHRTLSSRGLARSREILDLLYLYYNKADDHQTRQGSDLL